MIMEQIIGAIIIALVIIILSGKPNKKKRDNEGDI
jgi:hypothetical protein